MENYIGIDTGLGGAIALLNHEGLLKSVIDMPIVEIHDKKTKYEYDISAIIKFFDIFNVENTFCTLERTYAAPKILNISGAASWGMGNGYGIFCGILAAMKFSHVKVAPQTWQRVYFKGENRKGDSKARAFQLVRGLYPDAEITTKRGRVLDGRADAILIARYGFNYGSLV